MASVRQEFDLIFLIERYNWNVAKVCWFETTYAKQDVRFKKTGFKLCNVSVMY